jgi:hypothetical protein
MKALGSYLDASDAVDLTLSASGPALGGHPAGGLLFSPTDHQRLDHPPSFAKSREAGMLPGYGLACQTVRPRIIRGMRTSHVALSIVIEVDHRAVVVEDCSDI